VPGSVSRSRGPGWLRHLGRGSGSLGRSAAARCRAPHRSNTEDGRRAGAPVRQRQARSIRRSCGARRFPWIAASADGLLPLAPAPRGPMQLIVAIVRPGDGRVMTRGHPRRS
jgi:hypothetical protein